MSRVVTPVRVYPNWYMAAKSLVVVCFLILRGGLDLLKFLFDKSFVAHLDNLTLFAIVIEVKSF